MVDLDALKDRADAIVADHADALVAASRQLHADPELAFAERHAHDLLADLLDGAGLAVERGIHGVPTAFAARAGTTGPTVAVLCEYDALPGIGAWCWRGSSWRAARWRWPRRERSRASRPR